MPRRSRSRGALRRVIVVSVVGALAVTGVVLLLDRTVPVIPRREACSVEVDGTTWSFSAAQADNAALIAAVTVKRTMPARAATIGLATALQESKLVNIDYGDRDSVGLFQQRTSQGWGTIAQIMDPVYSTNAFFDGLEQIAGYTELPVTEAAQAVQRSGFPDAYAQHENRSRAWASALTGNSAAAVTCTLDPLEDTDLTDEAGTASALEVVRARILRDFGDLPVTADLGTGSVLVEVAPLAPEPEQESRVSWAVAQWAVATARATEVDAVLVGDQVWTRATREWTAVVDPASHIPAGAVRLRLASA